ncbi:MAG TPA: HAMP domain-containing sensor histidine kinase, partial [Bacteroidia bacterium]|nr:HAMP domain-containing sensor histidine kinase [Bacteroidia bacterium]
RYVLSSMWLMLGSSTLFTFIIVFGFAFTIHVILRQKKLSDIKTDFINNMTHEFKTPIATISLAVDSIKDPRVSSQPEKLEYFSRIIREENKRMNKQVEHVLQMAQLEKGELSLRRETVDLHDTIRQAVDSIGMQVASRGGKIETRMEALHPAVTGDPVHLMNVVLNLLDNANKYSPEAPDILIASNDHPGGILISVRDQGMGMTKETQKRIFEKFYRVPTGNIHDIKGFGLGLSYVKAIVEKHRGWIRLDSDPGKGSTFEIYIPHS